ncbi:MAG: type II toxin-antitoxin system MqsA family antitoxin [Armatimonadetes bacterium]|nr:type II toxin-antitoxin system MqsA family antitoxin [Armatimonadota bacterium]
MKCLTCKHGELGPGTATETVDKHGATLVLRHVPALVCDNCGEECFDIEVSRELHEIAEQAGEAGVTFMVREYGRAA